MKRKNDTLDDFLIENRKTFSVYHGRTYRKGPIVKGIGAMLVGILMMYLFIVSTMTDSNPMNLLLLLFALIGIGSGTIILFALDGVEIDTQRKELKEFVWLFKKFGKWSSIHNYPYITIIKLQKDITYNSYIGITVRDPLNSTMTGYGRTEENEEYEVCLLNKTHYKRITLYASKDYEKIKIKTQMLIDKLGVTYTQFNPVQLSDRKKRGRKK